MVVSARLGVALRAQLQKVASSRNMPLIMTVRDSLSLRKSLIEHASANPNWYDVLHEIRRHGHGESAREVHVDRREQGGYRFLQVGHVSSLCTTNHGIPLKTPHFLD